ncbi:MAG TPA: helix-turn-helix domain-containing protein [Steroidobacteraceae bacterium]|jgi:transcriptional regulator with XRE-family HTH domain|nr:helix-turn-helix domain-containing protein [Steroidobacteraceae bacterium]
MPVKVIRAVRAFQKARMLKQEDVARQIGISRPQLANAMRGRFGLSREAAANLREWLEAA